eukprot:UN05218
MRKIFYQLMQYWLTIIFHHSVEYKYYSQLTIKLKVFDNNLHHMMTEVNNNEM